MQSKVLSSLALLALLVSRASAQSAADSAGIRETALNYIEGWYEGNADRMAKAVHAELAKRIVARDPGRPHEFIHNMGATELTEVTRMGPGKKTPPDKRRKDLTILDISYGKAASVKVVAAEWVDYLHVAKVDGAWKIINVLWEKTPTAP